MIFILIYLYISMAYVYRAGHASTCRQTRQTQNMQVFTESGRTTQRTGVSRVCRVCRHVYGGWRVQVLASEYARKIHCFRGVRGRPFQAIARTCSHRHILRSGMGLPSLRLWGDSDLARLTWHCLTRYPPALGSPFGSLVTGRNEREIALVHSSCKW
jgi:hypothetical protein